MAEPCLWLQPKLHGSIQHIESKHICPLSAIPYCSVLSYVYIDRATVTGTHYHSLNLSVPVGIMLCAILLCNILIII